ncbi:hypothetical protein J2TS4_56370 [Paenibacillus sp. J2TS4]|nr:hypothetical protein J2TS4_56370 [Paenibacillus sp. J2TS4]
MAETPYIVIDPDIMMRNIQKMQEMADRHQVQLRPHIKTHKNSPVGQTPVGGRSLWNNCGQGGRSGSDGGAWDYGYFYCLSDCCAVQD